MNKKNQNYFYPFVFILVLLISSCESKESSRESITAADTATVTPKLESSVVSESVSDKEFVKKVNGANKAEIELAELALSKSTNTQIKSFAQQMVKDHKEAQSELKKLATSQKITLADTLDAENKALKKRLKSMNGADFDNAYAQSQLEAHEKAVQLFKTEIKQGKDKAVVNYANKYLPHIEMHLEKAKKLQTAVSKR